MGNERMILKLNKTEAESLVSILDMHIDMNMEFTLDMIHDSMQDGQRHSAYKELNKLLNAVTLRERVGHKAGVL